MRIGLLYKVMVIMVSISVIPLTIVGIISVGDAKDIGYSSVDDAEKMGETAVNASVEGITDIVADNFIRLGTSIAEKTVSFLEEREKDTLYISELSESHLNNITELEELLTSFAEYKTSAIWYNTHTTADPTEVTETVPMYTRISFIDPYGNEVIKIINGTPTMDLKNVSIPANTEFKNEEYFQKTKELNDKEVYVSRVNTWYVSSDKARGGVSGSQWDNIPGIDVMKWGDIKFATPIYLGGEFKGMVVLSVDYRHLAELTKHINPTSEIREVTTSYDKKNYILFFDDEGNTIVHPKPNNIRGYLPDGTLEHTNTIATPGGIFNLHDYDKSLAYREMYNASVVRREPYVTSSVDVSGKSKMTVTVPVPYDKGEYEQAGVFGGLMLSIDSSLYYETSNEIKGIIEDQTNITVGNIKTRTESLSSENVILFSLIIVVVISIVISLFLSRLVTKPLVRFKEVANRVSMGDVFDDTDIDVKSNDELGELAESFRRMVASIRASYIMMNPELAEEKLKQGVKE